VFFSVTKEEIFMLLSDKIKKFSVEQAIDYRNRNPVKNLPKLLDWADTFCAGKFEGQRRAISSEAYFRQLIDLGCLFIWYFHYMPVGNDASPGRQPPRRKRSKTRAKNAKKLCAKNAKAPSPSRETVLFPSSPRGDGQGTQSRTGKSVISAAGAASRDSKTKKRAWKGPSMHVSGQMGFPRLGLAAGQLCWPWAG
jgi:hypothetical protein